MVPMKSGQSCDVLLVDEANFIKDSMLKALSRGGGKNPATTKVFLGLPSCLGRFAFSNLPPALIELTPLSPSDARSYLLELATSAGSPDLFTTEAIDLIIDRSRGSVRSLRSIASFAFLRAASDEASQITLSCAASAVAAQVACDDASQINNRYAPSTSAAQFLSTPQRVEQSPAGISCSEKTVEKPAHMQKSSIDGLVCKDRTPTEDQRPGELRLAESLSRRRGNKTSTERQNDARPAQAVLHHPIWSAWERLKLSMISRRAPIVAMAAAATIGAVMQLMLAGTSSYSSTSYSSTRLKSVPAPVQASGFVGPTPALRPTVSNEPENIVKAAPVLSPAENLAAAKETPAGTGGPKNSVTRAAEEKGVTSRALTREEEAAVPRGIRELAPRAAGKHMLVVVHGVKVHASPSPAATVVSTLPRDLKVAMIERRGKWTLVEIKDHSPKPEQGWVFETFLKDEPGALASSGGSK